MIPWDWTERARIGDAIHALPEPERTVTRLRYHVGHDVYTIARMLDTSPACVDAVRLRALTRIKEALG